VGENRFLTCGLLGVDESEENPNEIFPEQSTNPLPIFAAPNLWLKNGGYLMAWEFFGGIPIGPSLRSDTAEKWIRWNLIYWFSALFQNALEESVIWSYTWQPMKQVMVSTVMIQSL